MSEFKKKVGSITASVTVRKQGDVTTEEERKAVLKRLEDQKARLLALDIYVDVHGRSR